jgi:hypothetical protein
MTTNTGSRADDGPASNEGAQRGQRNNPRQGGNQGRFNNRTRDRVPPPKKFAGKEEGLGDEFVYQHTDGRDATDQFTNSTDEIIWHCSTKYKNGADVERPLADGAKLVIELPAAPTPAGIPPIVPEAQMVIWKMKLQLSLQRGSMLDSNLESAYALIKGQCSKPILEKVEGQQAYNNVHQDRDPIGLLGLIKSVMFNYNSRKYRPVTLIDIIKPDLVSQSRSMSISEYLEKFRTQLDVLKSAGGIYADVRAWLPMSSSDSS